MFNNKDVLLLDMNSTFMFGEDRFGDNENYSEYYKSIGGKLPREFVSEIIEKVYNYLDVKYPSEEYRHSFPSLREAVDANFGDDLDVQEKEKIIETFSFHEHGHIPSEYVSVIKKLHERFTLSVVIDIWAPKDMWVNTFKELDLWGLFSA